nr:RNA-binding cell elongation regulator Jag/EloR [uncultured Mediterraneibacter sp.]
MNNSIRVSAKTVDDAITEALIQLGVTSDQLEYEVIEKGREGFLGIGMKQAVIEARRKTVKEEPVEEVVEEIVKEVSPAAVKEEIKKEKKDKRDREQKSEDRPVKKEKQDRQERPKKESELAKVEDSTIEVVKQFLKDTLAAMDMTVEITAGVDEEGALSVNMEGENMGILIGKRGQTLDSLQYLANRVANKNQDGYVRVKLDTENYRARRKDTLEHLAKNIAYKVKKTRRPVSLEPMNPYERRIIHAALQSDPRVTTHSEGEEPYRKVVVTLNRQ